MLGASSLCLDCGGVWVEMTFGVCPWGKGLVSRLERIFKAVAYPCSTSLHGPGVWESLTF
jgi:hypothetical protein